MKTAMRISTILSVAVMINQMPALGQTNMLPASGFHHLHLNSVDPDAAISFYTGTFPFTSKATWSGMPALKSPNNVLVLFHKVESGPLLAPQTALWHWACTSTASARRSPSLRPAPR